MLEALYGWKHPRAHIFWEEKLEEEGERVRRNGASLRFVYSLFPSLFSFLLMVIFFLEMF